MSVLIMSGVNISYEIASSGEQIKYYEDDSLSRKEAPNLANVIAGEIVNEILESALDIATQARDTEKHWKEIKESRGHHRATMNLLHVNENDSKNAIQKTNESHGDVVEHAGVTAEPDISEIIDGLNKISVNQGTEQDKQNEAEIEMQKLLAEMLSLHYKIVNYDNLSAKSGIGDQPRKIPENITNESIVEPEVSRAIEKKSRVTDLVKNSPRIISEYLMMNELAQQNQKEWEESTEQILQVIELDHVKPGEEAFRVQKNIFPEKVALPNDDDETELIQMPPDDIMDIVDLSSNAFKEEERQVSSTTENNTGAQGDDKNSDDPLITDKLYEETSSGAEVIKSIAANQKQLVGTHSNVIVEQEKPKKKKCNFGTRLWGFLKKGQKNHEQGSSTST